MSPRRLDHHGYKLDRLSKSSVDRSCTSQKRARTWSIPHLRTCSRYTLTAHTWESGFATAPPLDGSRTGCMVPCSMDLEGTYSAQRPEDSTDWGFESSMATFGLTLRT